MGPEYGFAYMMSKKGWNVGEDNTIRIIKASLDGQGNSQWVKPTDGTTENHYTRILDTIADAVQALPAGEHTKVNIAGLLYLQGESNNDANNKPLEVLDADTRFANLVTNLNNDLKAKGLNVTVTLGNAVAGEPATWANTWKTKQSTATAEKLRDLASETQGMEFVFTRDLGKIRNSAYDSDTLDVHYTGKSQITIGARYAYAMALAHNATAGEADKWEIGAVRSDYYDGYDYSVGITVSGTGDDRTYQESGMTVSQGTAKISLNDKRAWWDTCNAYTGAEQPLTGRDAIVVWDVSSANQEDTLSADFSVQGIRVEDPYRGEVVIKNANDSTNATLSIGSGGIALVNLDENGRIMTGAGAAGGNLTIKTDVALTASQEWRLSENRTLTLAGGVSGDYGIALTLGSGSTLSLGDSNGVTLSFASLSFGEGAAIAFDLTDATQLDKLVWTADTSLEGTLKLKVNVGKEIRMGSYTLVEGWTGGGDFLTSIKAAGGRTAGVSLVGSNLMLTVGSLSGDDYSVSFTGKNPVCTNAAGGLNNAWEKVAGDVTDRYIEYNQGTDGGWMAAVYNKSGEAGTGNVYMKIGSGTDSTASYSGVFGAWSASITGDVYLELDAGNSTYNSGDTSNWGSVNGLYQGGVVSGKLAIVIRDGTFSSFVAGCTPRDNKANGVGTGLYLQVDGGTFNGAVYGGASAPSARGATTTIDGGTHLLINDGAFNGAVYAGNGLNVTNATINNGTHMTINGGTFESHVVGGNATHGTINGGTEVIINDGTFKGYVTAGNNGEQGNAHGVINGDLNLTINGGTFTGGVYTGGFRGTVKNDIRLTITGGSFNCPITAGFGTDDQTVPAGTTVNSYVTLKGIDNDNDFYKSAVLGNKALSGKAGKNGTGGINTATLTLDDYTASRLTTNLSNFDAIRVVNGSDTELSTLGGATSLFIDSTSALGVESLALPTGEGAALQLEFTGSKIAQLSLGAGVTAAAALPLQVVQTEVFAKGAAKEWVIGTGWGSFADKLPAALTGMDDYALSVNDAGELVLSLVNIPTANITASGSFDAAANGGGNSYLLTDSSSATGSVNYYVSMADNHSGDVTAEVHDVSTNWLVAAGGSNISGTYTLVTDKGGDSEATPGYSGVFGALGVSGGEADVKLVLSNENATYNGANYSSSVDHAAVFGAFNSTVHDVDIELNAGTVGGQGIAGARNSTVKGDLSIAMTGGRVDGFIKAGAHENASTIEGNANITISGGTVAGDIYGGGSLGSNKVGNGPLAIEGKSTITIGQANAEVLTDVGNVYGGNEQNGAIGEGVLVAISDGRLGNVYGGNKTSGWISSTEDYGLGLLGGVYYKSAVQLSISGGDFRGNSVFGGNADGGIIGYYTDGMTVGNVITTISGGKDIAGFYGGNENGGTITGDSISSITAAAVSGNIFGGNKAGGTIGGAVNLTLNIAAPTARSGENILRSIDSSDQTVICNVYGGNDTDGTINGGVKMTINGGTFYGGVYGGNNEGGTIDGAVNLTVTDGTFEGPLCGGNADGGSIGGGINVTISGGSLNEVYAAGLKGSVAGDVALTISGGTFNSTISAGFGNAAGTTSGTVNTTVTLKDIAAGNTFLDFSGTLDGAGNDARFGTATLVLDNYTATEVNASIQNFNTISATNGTDTKLSSLGGAANVSVDATSALTIQSATEVAMSSLTLAEGATLIARSDVAISSMDIGTSPNAKIKVVGGGSVTLNSISDDRYAREQFVLGDDTTAGTLFIAQGQTLKTLNNSSDYDYKGLTETASVSGSGGLGISLGCQFQTFDGLEITSAANSANIYAKVTNSVLNAEGKGVVVYGHAAHDSIYTFAGLTAGSLTVGSDVQGLTIGGAIDINGSMALKNAATTINGSGTVHGAFSMEVGSALTLGSNVTLSVASLTNAEYVLNGLSGGGTLKTTSGSNSFVLGSGRALGTIAGNFVSERQTLEFDNSQGKSNDIRIQGSVQSGADIAVLGDASLTIEQAGSMAASGKLWVGHWGPSHEGGTLNVEGTLKAESGTVFRKGSAVLNIKSDNATLGNGASVTKVEAAVANVHGHINIAAGKTLNVVNATISGIDFAKIAEPAPQDGAATLPGDGSVNITVGAVMSGCVGKVEDGDGLGALVSLMSNCTLSDTDVVIDGSGAIEAKVAALNLESGAGGFYNQAFMMKLMSNVTVNGAFTLTLNGMEDYTDVMVHWAPGSVASAVSILDLHGEVDSALNSLASAGQVAYTGDGVVLGVEGQNGQVVDVWVTFTVPEPTTGTLSVLALAALAARRRRK